MITFVALRSGHEALAQASVTGAILGSVLVVPGLGMLIALSDVLVASVEELVSSFGFSELFLGVVLIRLVGGVAEHLVAVQQAYKKGWISRSRSRFNRQRRSRCLSLRCSSSAHD